MRNTNYSFADTYGNVIEINHSSPYTQRCWHNTIKIEVEGIRLGHKKSRPVKGSAFKTKLKNCFLSHITQPPVYRMSFLDISQMTSR